MYESFYGLTEKPFSIQPDPEFLYFGKRHTLAYSMLEYAIESQAAFCVVTGEIGCGKTTLIRHLLNHLPDSLSVGLVAGPHRETAGVLEWASLALGLPYEGLSGLALYDAFQRFLIKQYGGGRRVLLIIDEAQSLTPEDLEVLRMLSNINADKDQLLQIVLVGQTQFRAMLQRPELQQFAQRIAVHFHIPPLEQAEVETYIRYRLAIAGKDEPLFSPEACQRIADASRGIPRGINILCDTALVYGFSGELAWIDAAIVEDVIRDKAQYGVFTVSA
ncbi:MAG: general secretion pathway protein [Hydrogenophilales bacterium 28-61-23]|nr:MAG: general secretion pathway protein [Hydrogenophilales bacterium 28-61-23]